MEFWGVEVKAGEPLKVKPESSYVIHLSQACLGETKKDKGNDSILLNLKVGDQKLVLGLLSLGKIPQLSFDLVFEKEFELSHNWKNGSVYFCGYQTLYGEENDFSDLDDSEEEEEEAVPAVPSIATENGKGGQKLEQAKPVTAKSKAAKPESSAKPKVKVVEPSKDEDDEDSDDDVDSDDDDSDDESDDLAMLDADSDDDDEASDEDDDEETPKKVESSKKRPNLSAVKTPISVKKAKTDSAQKSGGKKGAHTATPHPAKNAGKTTGTAEKPKAQTPKSAGQFTCKSCTKSFGTESGLQSHSKAKHAGD